MQAFWVAIRSILWGLSLLCLIILIMLSAFGVFYKFNNYRSSEYEHKAQQVYSAIINDAARLSEIEKSRFWDQKSNHFYVTIEARSEADELQKQIENKAKEVCGYSCFASYQLSYDVYSTLDGSMQDAYAHRILDQLKRLADPDNNKEYNFINATSQLFSFITFVLSFYTLIMLINYKSLGWQKILFNCAIIFPFLATCVALELVRKEGEYDSINDNSLLVIPACIIYFFIIYPPTITLARRANIQFANSLLFWKKI